MRRWWIDYAAVLMLVSAEHGYCEIVVDQTFEPDGSTIAGGPASFYSHAQTFTVGVTGILRRVDAPIVVPQSGTIFWDVRGTTNGVPSEEILASGSLPGLGSASTNFEWVRLVVPAPGTLVSPGNVFALVLRNTGTSVGWWSGSADDSACDPYGRGAHFVLRQNIGWNEDRGADLGFRTYIEVDSLPQGYPEMFGPERVEAQWQFSVSGDSNHVYVFERSRDLQSWTPVLTNALRTQSRSFIVPNTSPAEFYRARVGRRGNTFALLVMQNIENFRDLQTDSFDSSDPAFSTNGRYDPNKRKAAGDLGLFGSVTSTSRLVQIYGKAWLSRNTTNFSLAPISSVGDLAWHAAGNTGVQSGYLREDLDGIYPAAHLPAGGGLPPVGGVVNGQSYQYILGNGFWILPSLALTNSNKMLVTGRAVLLVTSNLSVSGQARIQLQSAASQLTIYAGSSTSLSGQGIVGAVRPENFVYYGLDSNSQLTIQFSPFVGVIYAPKTDCIIQPVTPDAPNEIIGSCIVRTLRLDNSLSVHRDESLQEMALY